MATNPAKAPLTVMVKSGEPSHSQETSVALSNAAAQAMLVVTTIIEIKFGSTAIVLPGLKPSRESLFRR
jgi:hypothetical protein